MIPLPPREEGRMLPLPPPALLFGDFPSNNINQNNSIQRNASSAASCSNKEGSQDRPGHQSLHNADGLHDGYWKKEE